jgi:BMFP domain-containing protein YqiC
MTTDRRRVHDDEQTNRVLAEIMTRLEALEQRCENLEAEKVDKTAVADQVLEQLRRVRR